MRTYLIDLGKCFPLFLFVTLLSTYLVSFAYANTSFFLKRKVWNHKLTCCLGWLCHKRIVLQRLQRRGKRQSSAKFPGKWDVAGRRPMRRKAKGLSAKLDLMLLAVSRSFHVQGVVEEERSGQLRSHQLRRVLHQLPVSGLGHWTRLLPVQIVASFNVTSIHYCKCIKNVGSSNFILNLRNYFLSLSLSSCLVAVLSASNK